MWLLKSLLKAPPGSFRYEQTQGVYKKFDASPLIVHLAHSVSDLHKTNGESLPVAFHKSKGCQTCGRPV
jgi:hypothetical protein